MQKLLRSNKGQSATEYMLIVAVIVLGLVAAASKLLPVFRQGVEHLGQNVIQKLETNEKDSTTGGQ